MKNVNRIIGMMGLAVLLAVGTISCNKNDGKNSSFTFTLPTVEGFVADEGKAYIDISASGCPMKWWDGDMIKVYSVDATNTTPVMADFTAEQGCTGTTTTTFTGDQLEEGSIGYFAFYPANKAVSVQQGNYGTFNVGATQAYNSNLNIMNGRAFMDPQGVVAACPCDVLNGTANGVLKHIFGFANVRVKDVTGATSQSGVRSITITDHKVSLTGNMTINIAELTTARLNALKTLGTNYYNGSVNEEAYWSTLNPLLEEMGYSVEPDGNSVTLNLSGADVILDGTNQYFIIPLRPGALLGDFKVTVNFETYSQDFDFNGKQYIIRPGTFSNIQCTF